MALRKWTRFGLTLGLGSVLGVTLFLGARTLRGQKAIIATTIRPTPARSLSPLAQVSPVAAPSAPLPLTPVETHLPAMPPVNSGPALDPASTTPALASEAPADRSPSTGGASVPSEPGLAAVNEDADPEKAATDYLEKTRREADATVTALRQEAETLRERLKKIEAALHHWDLLLSALNPPSQPQPQIPSEPAIDPMPSPDPGPQPTPIKASADLPPIPNAVHEERPTVEALPGPR